MGDKQARECLWTHMMLYLVDKSAAQFAVQQQIHLNDLSGHTLNALSPMIRMIVVNAHGSV